MVDTYTLALIGAVCIIAIAGMVWSVFFDGGE